MNTKNVKAGSGGWRLATPKARSESFPTAAMSLRTQLGSEKHVGVTGT